MLPPIAGLPPEAPSEFNRFFDIVEDVVGPDSKFASSRVQHLYDWWAAAATASDGIPPRRAFDIVDHKAIVAHIFITDVEADGNFRFRLLGEEAIRIVGRNNTGKIVNSQDLGQYGHALDEYYRTVVARRCPLRCRGSLQFAGNQFRRFESIDCPLADADQRIATIIGVIDMVA